MPVNIDKNLNILNWMTDSANRRSVIFIAGGFVAVSLGGYWIYKRFNKNQSKNPSTDLIDDSEMSSAKKSTSSSSKKSQRGDKIAGVTYDYSATRCDALRRAQQLKEKGNQLFKEKQYEKAVQVYTEAIQICPEEQTHDLAIFYQNRAAAYEKLDDFEKVYEDCTKSLQLNKNYTKALSRRATACEKLQRYKQFLQDSVKLCVMENFQYAHSNMKADAALKIYSTQLAKEHMEKREEKKLPLSKFLVADIIRSTSRDPIFSKINNDDTVLTNGFAHGDSQEFRGYEKALKLLMNKQYDEIVVACTEELDSFDEKSSHFFECLLLRATFYNFHGLYKRAEHDLKRVLDALSDKLDDQALKEIACAAHLKLAYMYHQQENEEECFKNFEMAEKLVPDNPDIFNLRAQVYGLKGDYDRSKKDCLKCIELNPDFVHFQIQLLTMDLKKCSENADQETFMKLLNVDFKQLIEKFPTNVEANLIYSQMLLEMQQIDTAIKYLEKAQKLDPENPNILAHRAIFETYKGNEEEMIKYLEKALKVDPYCLMALDLYAQHHGRRNDVPKMTELYDKILQMVRNETEARHFIAMREATLNQMQIAEEIIVNP